MIKNDKRTQIDFRMNGNSQDQNIVSLKKRKTLAGRFNLTSDFKTNQNSYRLETYLKQNKTKTRIENES
jgi:hypothetical protein